MDRTGPIGAIGRNVSRVVALSDSKTYNVHCTNYFGASRTVSDSLEVLPPTVDITSANLTTDNIQIELLPTSTTGILTVTLMGDSGSNHRVFSGPRSGGSHAISFGALSSITQGQYMQIKATWAVTTSPSDFHTYNFRALGTYRHSQYNSPAESLCANPATSSYNVTNVSCNFSSGTLRTEFSTAVILNGSGHSISYNDVAPEQFCLASRYNPPHGATLENTFRRDHAIRGAHGAVGNNTVAFNPMNLDIKANSTVYIDTVGTKTVTDKCVGCSETQLDNYTTSRACSGIADLGNFATFLIN